MNQEKPTIIGRQLKIVLWVAGLLCAIWLLYAIRGVLAPFVLAFVLAYVLAPLIDWMESRGVNRTISIVTVFLTVVGSLAFGAFKAGGKLTDEMIDLSDQFLREEIVEREIAISNTGKAVQTIDYRWTGSSQNRVFTLLDSTKFPLSLAVGGKQQLRFAFAPKSIKPSQAVLLFSVSNLQRQVALRMRGNARPLAEGAIAYEFWERGGHEDELSAQTVIVSARGIDFGRAGPNIISHISEKAEEIQPKIQPYIGADLDLADLVTQYGRSLTDTLLGGTSGFVGGLVSGITFLVIVPFVAFFFLREGRRITRGLIELVPNSYFELCLNLLYQINGQIGGYIRGQLLAVSVVALLAVVGLTIIGMPYSVPVGIIAGLANMIPYLGPLIGILTGSIVTLATGGGMSLVTHVIVVFLIVQLIDNILIQPTIVAKNVDLHPLVVLFVVMVGSQLMGIVGMLVAVPLTGIAKVSGQTVYQGIKGYRAQ